jgi:hypothetical protein
MEPRPSEKPVESSGECQTAPPRSSERKRRFQIVKLEERIAPCSNMYGCGDGRRSLAALGCGGGGKGH